MKRTEFMTEYEKLQEAFPKNGFDTPAKLEAVARVVMPLSHSWWKKLVLQVIAANNPFEDFAEAANAERKAIASVERTNSVVRAQQELERSMSERGLPCALSSFGANSVWEAVMNSRKKSG